MRLQHKHFNLYLRYVLYWAVCNNFEAKKRAIICQIFNVFTYAHRIFPQHKVAISSYTSNSSPYTQEKRKTNWNICPLAGVQHSTSHLTLRIKTIPCESHFTCIQLNALTSEIKAPPPPPQLGRRYNYIKIFQHQSSTWCLSKKWSRVAFFLNYFGIWVVFRPRPTPSSAHPSLKVQTN